MTKRVLITGAAGDIGSSLVQYIDARQKPYSLRLADLSVSDPRGMVTNISDLDACRQACEGIDTVIHLAADPDPSATFDDLLPVNIVGPYNIFKAALEQGVKRVIFASSIHAVSGYPDDVQIHTDMPVRPEDLYGVSKAYGEALAAYYAYQTDLEAIAVRIGYFKRFEEWPEPHPRELAVWSEPQDLCGLLVQCIEAELGDTPFVIAHGISNNQFKRMDISTTQQMLGYAPQSDAFAAWGISFTDPTQAKS